MTLEEDVRLSAETFARLVKLKSHYAADKEFEVLTLLWTAHRVRSAENYKAWADKLENEAEAKSTEEPSR